jgi:hypothetical protein
MTTVVFVHGTGVRRDAYNASYEKVASGLSGARVSVVPCYWGDLGSDLHSGGASIPEYDSTRSHEDDDIAPASEEEYRVGLWGILYQDPLFELRVLAVRGKVAGSLSPGSLRPGAELARLGRQFEITSNLQLLLEKGGIAREFKEARLSVTSSEPYCAALDSAPASLSEYRDAIARSIIATATTRVKQAEMPAAVVYDASLCGEIEHLLIEALGGHERGIGGWVKGQFGGMAARLGSRLIQRRRGAVTDAAYPAAGDILLYQARGQAIRDFIKSCAAAVSSPCVLLAHSLGGIACVDLMVKEQLNVQLLVTVGSQAPFLYEIDALQSLRYGRALPGHFCRWLNIYDLRDFLSYVGTKVFPGRVKDVEVDNRQPFPVSHSAYWSNEAVWKAIKEELP